MIRASLPRRTTLATAALIAATLAAYAFTLRLAFTSAYHGANDFYIPWYAIRALLWEGRDPYGASVTSEIQHNLFGRPREPGEHQFDFAYPLTVAPLLAPYTLLPYDWAQPFWQATLHLLLLGSLLLWLRIRSPRLPAPLPLAALLLWAVSVYPAARAFILGQIAVLVLAATVLAVWGLARRQDVLAGAALAVATIKPQASFLIVPSLLFLAWSSGRRRVLWSFGATTGALLAASLCLMPSWPLAFLRRLAEYLHYTGLGQATDSPSPLALLARPLGQAAPWLEGLLLAALLVPLASYLWKERLAPAWQQVASALVIAGAWVTPRAATTDQILLLLPLLFLLRRRSRMAIVATGGLLWVGLWLLFLATVQGDQEHPLMRLPLPLLVLALWIWDRTRGRSPSPDGRPGETLAGRRLEVESGSGERPGAPSGAGR